MIRDAVPDASAARTCVLVWIDAEEAILVRWDGDEADVSRLASDVPGRRRSTGHVRHDPRVRRGGGGTPQSAGEPRRLELLRRFVDSVADLLATNDDLLILGPGTVRKRLERAVGDADGRDRRERAVASEASPRLTEPQLVARLRTELGQEPPRRVAGASSTAVDPED